jgi:osmoprotectant transport system ATP-binding protein
MAALLVTHDLHEASRLADRVAVLRAGKLEQFDEPAILAREPATPYVRDLLARAHVAVA